MVFETIKQKTLIKDSIKSSLQLKFWGTQVRKYWSREKQVKEKRKNQNSTN